MGSSAASWETKPMPLLRCNSCGVMPDSSMLPEVAAVKPPMARSSVVLPQPLGPISDTNSDGATSRLTSRRTSSLPASVS